MKKSLLILVGVAFCFLLPMYLLFQSLGPEGEFREDALAAAQISSTGAGRAALHDEDLRSAEAPSFAAAAGVAAWAADDPRVDRARALEASGSLMESTGQARWWEAEARETAVETDSERAMARIQQAKALVGILFGDGTSLLEGAIYSFLFFGVLALAGWILVLLFVKPARTVRGSRP